ncbi:hypothetical protein ENSA5_20330 [Enhygromyxa salina]|uniref:Uncharacterized protein n=2 Tax=Enhygromyxa salina TaxID=215803 RepID=A0A2S9YCV9_9BACT|nr:hypothetical protein ENSA5_20330 [Enhygromyxa salina]
MCFPLVREAQALYELSQRFAVEHIFERKGGAHEHPMDGRKVVVTLVCATADEDTLEDVLDGLHALGHEAGLVAGVDERPRRVGDAIERCGDLGLIVVCTSARLDGPALRKVEGLFSARRGPNHAMVRVDVGLPTNEAVAAIQRAVEGFVSNQGRIVRRHAGEGPKLREVVHGDVSSLALPVVRLEAGEELDGDTRRIQLPDNPKSAELSRRRRAVRERERQRERITRSHRPLSVEESEAGHVGSRKPMIRDEDKLDRTMVLMIVGAGVLAVLAALTWFS